MENQMGLPHTYVRIREKANQYSREEAPAFPGLLGAHSQKWHLLDKAGESTKHFTSSTTVEPES